MHKAHTRIFSDRDSSWAISPTLTSIWKHFGDRRPVGCGSAFVRQELPAERFQLLQEALLSRLCHGVEQHYAVSAALDMFGRNQAGPTVRKAATHLGLSQRRFIEVFKAELDMAPKLFSRIQRFQA